MKKVIKIAHVIPFLFLVGLMQVQLVYSQPKHELIEINIGPDHADWKYEVGEQVKFSVSVLQYGNPLKDIEIRYEIGPEKMDPEKEGTLVLKNGETVLKGGTMKTPGFLRCWVYATVDGKEYKNLATAAFDEEQIEPTATLPDDFKSFWKIP